MGGVSFVDCTMCCRDPYMAVIPKKDHWTPHCKGRLSLWGPKGSPKGLPFPMTTYGLSNRTTILQQILIWTGGLLAKCKARWWGRPCQRLTIGLLIRAVKPYGGQWGPEMSCHPICGPTGSSQGQPCLISANELLTWLVIPYREAAGNSPRSQ